MVWSAAGFFESVIRSSPGYSSYRLFLDRVVISCTWKSAPVQSFINPGPFKRERDQDNELISDVCKDLGNNPDLTFQCSGLKREIRVVSTVDLTRVAALAGCSTGIHVLTAVGVIVDLRCATDHAAKQESGERSGLHSRVINFTIRMWLPQHL